MTKHKVLVTTFLPDDGAPYKCSYGDWCKKTDTRAASQEDVTEFNRLAKLWHKRYPKGALPPHIMRSLCSTHIRVVGEQIDMMQEYERDGLFSE